jgi:hypothetical protein
MVPFCLFVFSEKDLDAVESEQSRVEQRLDGLFDEFRSVSLCFCFRFCEFGETARRHRGCKHCWFIE